MHKEIGRTYLWNEDGHLHIYADGQTRKCLVKHGSKVGKLVMPYIILGIWTFILAAVTFYS